MSINLMLFFLIIQISNDILNEQSQHKSGHNKHSSGDYYE